MQFTLRQLEYLVAVAEHGSFHAASRACHVTQPGLSTQIQQLEAQLGVQVFERDRRKVLVTSRGADIVRRARVVLEAAEHLAETARAGAGLLTGRLRLGIIPTVAPYWLPQVLPRVRKRYPELMFRLYEGQTAELVEMIRQGRLDLLIVALEAKLDGLETLALFSDPFVVALPDTHRLAKRKRLAEADLQGETVLLLEDGHCLRDQALTFCQRAGADEDPDFRASSLTTLVQMVASGAGVTFLPTMSLAVEGRVEGLCSVPFAQPVPSRTIGLAWRSTSPRADEYRLLAELFGAGREPMAPRSRGRAGRAGRD